MSTGFAETETNTNGANIDLVSAAQVTSGTAFYVSRDGKALTSAHVVKDCRQITLWMQDESPRFGTIIGIDATRDIALLASHAAVHDFARVDTTVSARTGEPVTTIAFGIRQHEPRRPEVTTGTVFGQAVLPSGSRIIVVSAELKQGNSGGPVIDDAGSLLGVVIGRYTARPDLSVAVPAPDLGRFLARHGVSLAADDGNSTDSAGDEKDRPTNESRLLRISALVQCEPRRLGQGRAANQVVDRR